MTCVSIRPCSLISVLQDRKVNVRGQRTAFPPNYIHSIDAAHMMMTALRCHDAGITFAGQCVSMQDMTRTALQTRTCQHSAEHIPLSTHTELGVIIVCVCVFVCLCVCVCVVTGIHDSFMTHAGTVDQMSAILREQFVLLHSQPLLEELHAFMSKRVTHGNTLDELPPTGELDLKDVIKSTYFFS